MVLVVLESPRKESRLDTVDDDDGVVLVFSVDRGSEKDVEGNDTERLG